ncbi:MAG: hypothetical protein ACI8Z7_000865 [Candidatus Nanohaloarchaea archaeon]|jgi:hypothetical protein
MVVQRMKRYEIDIEDPRQIPSACDFAEERALEEGMVLVGLNHNHYGSVKGYSENLSGLGNELELELGYPAELNREDGGNMWNHSPESQCLMIATRNRLAEKNHEEKMKYWGKTVEQKIDELSDFKPLYRAGDIYDQEGDQLVGASGDFTGETDLYRICFYEGEDHGKTFHEIVEKDLELNESMTDFRDRYKPVDGFYEEILGENPVKVSVEPVEEPFMRFEGGNPPKYCI